MSVLYPIDPDLEDILKEGFDWWFYSETSQFSYICEYFSADLEVEDPTERRDLMLKWLREAYRIGYEDGSYPRKAPTKELVDSWAKAADPKGSLLMQIAAKGAEWGALNC
jgi:hypothetical protein